MLLCYLKKSLFRVHSNGDTRQSDWFPSNTTIELVMRLFNNARLSGPQKEQLYSCIFIKRRMRSTTRRLRIHDLTRGRQVWTNYMGKT